MHIFWWIVIILLVIGIISLVSKESKKTKEIFEARKADKREILKKELLAQRDTDAIITEFTYRQRVTEDCIQLIEKTNNIDTLLTRSKLALEHYDWIKEQIKNGAPLTLQTDGDFHERMKEALNIHIPRIAKHQYLEYEKTVATLKQKKAIENRTTKIFEFIDQCKSELCEAVNKDEALKEIEDIHFLIEDKYSDKSQIKTQKS